MSDSDAVSIDDLKSPKTLFQKLFSRDSIPTVYALFSALSFIGALKDISNLAHALLSGFDGAVLGLAGFLNRLIPLPFGIEVTKSVVMYSGALFFGIGGLISLFRKEKIFRNELEVYISLLCILVISIAFVSRVDGLDYSIIYEGDLLVMVAGYLAVAFGAYALLKYVLKVPRFGAYLIAGTLLPTLLPSLYFAFSYGHPGVYGQIVMTFVTMTVLLLLFALNPKRLRQVTLFILLFAALAFISIPLNAVLGGTAPTDSAQNF
jgi:hypothetical protein